MPRVPVEAPKAQVPKYGLIAALGTQDTADERWVAPSSYIQYLPEGCVEGQTLDPCDPDDLSADAYPDVVAWKGYILSVRTRCSTLGGIEEGAARAQRLLFMDQERQLGAELWDGTLAQSSTLTEGGDWPNTWLANVADVDILSESGPVGFVHALACLEQYLAENNGGQQGVIHATVQTIVHWESFRLLRREGNRILTFQDNIVIQSPGYTGTDPNGNVGDNNIWAYATDVPRVYLGTPRVTEVEGSVDRVNNTAEFTAFRPGLVEWERCRHAGVRLAMSVCDVGGS